MSRESLLRVTTESRRLASETMLWSSKWRRKFPKPWDGMYGRLLMRLEEGVKDLPEYDTRFRLMLQELVYSFVLNRQKEVESGSNGQWKDEDKWKDILFRLSNMADKAREKKLERNIFAAMASVLEEKVEDEVIRKDLLGSIVKKLSEIKEE